MDVRKKLVEIVCDVMESDGCIGHCNHSPCFEVERVVNALIDNGVTVQEWISVDDRLPEMGEHYQSEDVLVCIDYRPDDPDTTKDSYVSIDHVDFNCFGQGWFSCERDDPRDGEPSPYFVTHWMPMPNPPKGE